MKHFLTISLLSLGVFFTPFTPVIAQNVQVHYDFGKFIYDKDMHGRPLITTTVEMFKPDSWGSTFFFVDMDYKSSGVAGAYWEISRELQFWKLPLSLHLEYNGGLNFVRNAYLSGVTYTFNNKGYSFGYTASAMYKYIQQQDFNEPHNFQLTYTWYWHFGQKVFTFSGFADYWREKTLNGNYIFLSEPQIWLHLNQLQGYADDFNLSIGSEMKVCYNFAARQGIYLIPTVAVRWDF